MKREKHGIQCSIPESIDPLIELLPAYPMQSLDDEPSGDLSYVKSARGHTMLKKDGHMFTLNRKKCDTFYWECVKKKSKEIWCNARVVTQYGHLKSFRGNHNHDHEIKYKS